jgi:hypothetical protein
MVETDDSCVGHDAHAVVDRLARVVEHSVEVGLGGETEAGTALLAAVHDDVGSVGEGGDAGNYALGGLGGCVSKFLKVS